MVAVYFNPAVCDTWAGYFIVECWGFIVPAVAVPMSIVIAIGYRALVTRARRIA